MTQDAYKLDPEARRNRSYLHVVIDPFEDGLSEDIDVNHLLRDVGAAVRQHVNQNGHISIIQTTEDTVTQKVKDQIDEDINIGTRMYSHFTIPSIADMRKRSKMIEQKD